jgi:hypothetical protein
MNRLLCSLKCSLGRSFYYLFIYLFLRDWGLNSGLHACKAGTLLLEPHLRPFCSAYFGDEVSQIVILPTLALQVAGITSVSHWHPVGRCSLNISVAYDEKLDIFLIKFRYLSNCRSKLDYRKINVFGHIGEFRLNCSYVISKYTVLVQLLLAK